MRVWRLDQVLKCQDRKMVLLELIVLRKLIHLLLFYFREVDNLDIEKPVSHRRVCLNVGAKCY